MINLRQLPDLLQQETALDYQQRKKYKELLEKATMVIVEAWEKIKSTGEFGDFQKVLDEIEQECGQKMVRLKIDVLLNEEEVGDLIFYSVAGRVQTPEPIAVTQQDQEILKNLQIKFGKQDQDEIQKILERNKTSEETLSEADVDPRTISQIINDVRTAAKNVNPESRVTVARQINMKMGMVIPTATSRILFNNTFWLQQIQMTVNKIREQTGSVDKLKLFLVVLENIIKSKGVKY